MGLLDVLNGMQNGPRGASNQDPSRSGGGGMSPLTMALLGLIAYKAIKRFGGSQPSSSAGSGSAPSAAGGNIGSDDGGRGGFPSGGLGGSGLGGSGLGSGGLGDLLKGGLGSLFGGGAAGGVLSGGLNDLLTQFEQSGKGDVARSWVGSGPNKAISPDELANTLGADQINTLTAQTGMSRDDLLRGLSQHLPGLIDHLTPNGRVPTEQEAAHLL